MKWSDNHSMNPWRSSERWVRQNGRLAPVSALHLVSLPEVENLRQALAKGLLPTDFLAKLARLSTSDLTHHIVGQQSRLFISLLLAAGGGAFQPVAPEDRERLLRVLAYVRKENDAIADYEPDGFIDDLEEIRAAAIELQTLLRRYKHWRLEHQVPALWRNQPLSSRNDPGAGSVLPSRAGWAAAPGPT